MPTVFLFRRLKFCIYPKDHNPPHVHVRGVNFEVKVDLESFEVISIKGSISSRELKLIVSQIKQRHDDLLEAWNDYCN